VEQFDPQVNQWLLRQKLDKRTQGVQEAITDYTADIRRLCTRLKLPKGEGLHCFMRGLKPALKNYVYLQQPKTFEDAEYLARLKSSVSTDSEPQIAAVMSQIGNVVTELKNIAIQQTKPNTEGVAAFGPSQQQRSYPPKPQWNSGPIPVYKEDLDQMMRELRREIRSSRSNSNRSNNFGRNRRTINGDPICNSCSKAGHISIRCRSRDPSIKFNR
jgi:hypothetical protein